MREATRLILKLMARQLHVQPTINAGNGSEFHHGLTMGAITDPPFHFDIPHHSREQGTNENSNGWNRRYLPKGTSMTVLIRRKCEVIAAKRYSGPRKRLRYLMPNDVFLPQAWRCTSLLMSPFLICSDGLSLFGDIVQCQ